MDPVIIQKGGALLFAVIRTPGQVVATFTDANPSASLADFSSATIDWGDGSPTDSGVVALSGGSFVVLGNHAYAAAGSYTVTTTLVDRGGSTATATGTVSVGIPEGQSYDLNLTLPAPSVGGTSASAAAAYTATVNWGDGSSSPAVVNLLPGSSTLQVLVTASHVYTEEGSYTASVTVSDGHGGRDGASQTVLVTDAPLSSAGVNVAAVAGTTTGQVVVATFTDANPYGETDDFLATLTWGDGSTSTSGTVQANSDGSFRVLASHTYATAGSYSLRVNITDDGGQATTATSTATVTAPWTAPVPPSGGDDPDRALLLPLGEASVDLEQGSLRLSHPLDFDQSPGTSVGGSPALVYNSATVSARPVVQLAVQTDPNGQAPVQAQVQLTFNGTTQSPATYLISGQQPGVLLHLAAQVASPVTTSGVYPWSALVTLTLADNSTQQVTLSGTTAVVARDSSVYGAGWALDGVPQLLATGGGILWITGAGDTRFFSTDSQGNYLSPAEDFGSLVQNGSSFTYTAKDQTKWNFDSQGRLTSVVDTHGLARTYGYDSAGRLSQVLAVDGGLTTLVYDSSSGLLNSIVEPGDRIVQLQHDSNGDLTGITDVDNTTRTFGYGGGHRVTSDTWAPLNASFSYDSTTGLLTQVNRGLGSSYEISSVPGVALAAPSGTAGWSSVTDGLQHTTKYQLDGRGRLLQQVLADGTSTTSYQRDAAGQVTQLVDPLHHATTYTYAYGAYNGSLGGGDGDLLLVSYADGGFDSYQYDPTFHEVTRTANALGLTSTNSYDPNTGDLLQSTDALGNTTNYVWSAGLLLNVTDPLGNVSSYGYDNDRRQVVAYDNLGVPTFTSYDSNGNPASSTDALGDTTLTLYSPRGLLLQTSDANGDVSSQSYNGYGEQTSQTNARGFTATTSYDQRGWVTAQTDFLGGTTETDQYDAAGNLIEQSDALGHATTFRYDVDNRLTATIDTLGDTSTTAYDAAGDVTSSTDALGQTTTFTYDVCGRQVSSTDPLQRTTSTVYDLAGRVVQSIDPTGTSTRTFYDLDGRPVAVRDGQGNTTFTSYDADGNVSATTDGQGNTTFYRYDADNRQVSTTDPDQHTSRTNYDLLGNVISSTDARGQTTQYEYDSLNRQVVSIDADAQRTETGYDAVGNVVASVDANHNPTWTSYDGDNRPISGEDADHYFSHTVYDAAGNVTASQDQNGQWTDTTYDELNRPTLVVDPDGHLTQTTYNAVGEVVATTDGAGDSTTKAYDADGEVTATWDGDGHVTTQQFDQDGRLLAVTDPDGNVTQYRYDGVGNQVATIDPLGNVSASQYDHANRLVVVSDRNGRQRTFAYDGAGQLLTETWYNADGSVADTLRYSYDPDGNLLTASNNYGSYTYTYDDAGQVRTQTDPFGLTLTYGHDNNGNVTSVQDSLGGQLTSVYDADNRMTSRQVGGTGQTPLRIDLTYTGEGQVASATRYGDLAGTLQVGSSAFTYDNAGQLAHLQHKNASGGVVADYGYSYDTAGQLSSETDNGVTTSYGYDNADQLTSAGSSGYSYDANGNRTLSGYQTGANNELQTDGTWNYSYDHEGNLIQKVLIADGSKWQYGYDNANHLVSATQYAADGSLVQRVTFQYDVFGNRVEEDVYTAATGQTSVQRFAYDGQNVWADLNGSNQLVMRRLYLDGVDQPFARIDASGTAAWYLADRLGSIRDIMNASGTAVLDHIDYDAFGNVTNETAPANEDRYKYTAREADSVTGLQYSRARFYDPKTARWLSQDPSGFAAGDSNLYRYVGNDATNATDPQGQWLVAANDEAAKAFIARWTKGGTTKDGVPFEGAGLQVETIPLPGGRIFLLIDPRYGSKNTNQELEEAPKLNSDWISEDWMKTVIRAGQSSTEDWEVYNADAGIRSTNLTPEESKCWIDVRLSLLNIMAFDRQVKAELAAKGLGPGPVSVRKIITIAASAITPRPDLPELGGGRSGEDVKDLTGPPNSAIRGSPAKRRVYVTNDEGKVILDITKNRVKPVVPGVGFGRKRAPTAEELELIEKLFGGS